MLIRHVRCARGTINGYTYIYLVENVREGWPHEAAHHPQSRTQGNGSRQQGSRSPGRLGRTVQRNGAMVLDAINNGDVARYRKLVASAGRCSSGACGSNSASIR